MRDKILKLLTLTGSDSDGEALSAIRMANKILKAQGLTWQDFFGNKRESLYDQTRQSYEAHYQRARKKWQDEMEKEVNRKMEESRVRQSQLSEMLNQMLKGL